MAQSISNELTRDHVLLALQDLDAGIEHSFGAPTKYELVHNEKRYPPRAVVGIAHRHLAGSILTPDAFSGGEGPGQANYVLRNLGFTVQPIRPHQGNAYVTSRRFALPTSIEELAGRLWFNLWQQRLWPYREVDVGDTLYWYDPTARAIVWNTTVRDVDRFKYESKEQLRSRLHERFGEDPVDDPYYAQAANQGYCIAYKVTPVEQLNLPKPTDYGLPRLGWLQCKDPEAQAWLSQWLPQNRDGKFTSRLRQTASRAEDEGYFEARNLEDERERKLGEIVHRRGQPEFRAKLIDAYGGCCAVTASDAVQALEAAHITPYLGPQSNHISNGLLLRADIHTLFDLDLLGIDPDSLTVVLSEQLQGTCYEELNGKKLMVPDDPASQPSKVALEHMWKRFQSEA